MEFEEDKKTLKLINIDNFSVEHLEEYIESLTKEIKRTEEEIKKNNY